MTTDEPSHDWLLAVLDAVRDTLLAGDPHVDTGVTAHAAWLAGACICIVYTVDGFEGIRGRCTNTTSGITVPIDDPQVLGQEIVYYGIWEPHEAPPRDGLSVSDIGWFGDAGCSSITDVGQIPENAQIWRTI